MSVFACSADKTKCWIVLMFVAFDRILTPLSQSLLACFLSPTMATFQLVSKSLLDWSSGYILSGGSCDYCVSLLHSIVHLGKGRNTQAPIPHCPKQSPIACQCIWNVTSQEVANNGGAVHFHSCLCRICCTPGVIVLVRPLRAQEVLDRWGRVFQDLCDWHFSLLLPWRGGRRGRVVYKTCDAKLTVGLLLWFHLLVSSTVLWNKL